MKVGGDEKAYDDGNNTVEFNFIVRNTNGEMVGDLTVK